jgi:lipoate-protein ligase B
MVQASLIDLGFIRYAPAFTFQEQVFNACIEKQLAGAVILQENLPIFTIGRAGSLSNVLATPEELQHKGIQVLEVNRGGDVTYHGPGQLIVSLLFYLGDLELNANQFLHKLEDVIISLLKEYGIEAHKEPEHPGAWVNEAKIGSVGLAVRHGYTFHGFSINTNLDLSPFQLINPCGVPQMPVTSISKICGRDVPVSEIKPPLLEIIKDIFKIEFSQAPLAGIAGCEDLAEIIELLRIE